MITSEQVGAARALLRWDQRALADAAKLPLSMIARLEAAPGALAAEPGAIEAIRKAFETAGLDLIGENGGGVGVRLKRPSSEAISLEDLNASNDE